MFLHLLLNTVLQKKFKMCQKKWFPIKNYRKKITCEQMQDAGQKIFSLSKVFTQIDLPTIFTLKLTSDVLNTSLNSGWIMHSEEFALQLVQASLGLANTQSNFEWSMIEMKWYLFIMPI